MAALTEQIIWVVMCGGFMLCIGQLPWDQRHYLGWWKMEALKMAA